MPADDSHDISSPIFSENSRGVTTVVVCCSSDALRDNANDNVERSS